MEEYLQGTLMWFGRYEVRWISSEEFISSGGSVMMFPDGNIIFHNGFSTNMFHRGLIEKIKMLGVPQGENDVFWQHPDYREGDDNEIDPEDERT